MKFIKGLLYKIILLFIYSGNRQKKYFTGKEKSYLTKFLELFRWMLRDNQFNFHYYAYGLNLSGTYQNKHIGRREFLSLQRKIEIQISKKYMFGGLSYEVLTKDKFINYTFLKSLHIPVVEIKRIIKEHVIDLEGNIYPMESLFEVSTPFVLKNTILEYGEGFMLCYPDKGKNLIVNGKVLLFSELKSKINSGIWIMQEVVESHPAIRKINNSALNTTRIVTILNGNKPQYLTGFQSFATDNQINDSWGKGAVYVGLDINNECLKEFGYYHPSIPEKTITSLHPDSQIIFKDYNLPYIKEALEICLKAHQFMFHQFVIGWDVAITDNGPMILEANEKPGMNAVQVIDGGLREIILSCFENTIKYYT